MFDPVELGGTMMSRASVHNLSIVGGPKPEVGDIIAVYEASMIIPQVVDSLARDGIKDVPGECPVCSRETRIE